MTIKSNIVKKEERNINNMQNNLASMIKEKKLFLLDIDGTVALGSELLPGAADFLQTVKENGGIFRFLTNNSSKAASDYVEQFHDWGIETTEEEFITAGTYARDFMKKYYGNEKILVAATETYCSELRKADLNITDQAGDDVDCVLCTYDTELTYEKLVQVCKQLTETKVPKKPCNNPFSSTIPPIATIRVEFSFVNTSLRFTLRSRQKIRILHTAIANRVTL